MPIPLLVLCLNVQWICFLSLFQLVTCEAPSRDNISSSEQSGQEISTHQAGDAGSGAPGK